MSKCIIHTNVKAMDVGLFILREVNEYTEYHFLCTAKRMFISFCSIKRSGPTAFSTIHVDFSVTPLKLIVFDSKLQVVRYWQRMVAAVLL